MKAKRTVFWSCLIWILCSGMMTLTQAQNGIVTTKSGPVRGIFNIRAASGKLMDIFLGIPFAKPPLGPLRFKAPLPVEPWKEILEANELPPDCYQNKMLKTPFNQKFHNPGPFSEDCLKLNIWLPKSSSSSEKLPVVVFIHPGGFVSGGSRAILFDGSCFATEQNVIVVIFNYRLASLGFLYLGHPDIPGNAGLLDQVLAIQWVKDNIESFGGDPELITLMGQSAGAASIIYHYLSPLSAHLFKRGIVESGAPHHTYSYIDKETSLERAKQLALNMGCSSGMEKKEDMIRCFMEADPEDLISNEPRPEGVDNDIIIFNPVVDGHFLPESPFEILKKGGFKKSELLMGNNRDEGSLFLLLFDPFIFSPFQLKAPITLRDVAHTFRGKATFNEDAEELFMDVYFGHENTLESNMSSIVRIVSDYIFNCPIKEVELQMAQAGNTLYTYFFVHRSVINPFPKWIGNYHGEELLYTIGNPYKFPDEYTEEEVEFSHRIKRYWGNFARTGNPNVSPNGKDIDSHWPKYTTTGKEYLVLAPNSSSVGTFFRHKSCRFITKTLRMVEKNAKRHKRCFV